MSVLELLSAGEPDQIRILDEVLQSPSVTEAMVLATCNRLEIYAVVDTFQDSLSAIKQVLAQHAGMPSEALSEIAYIRHSEEAAQHLFLVAAGLDSAVAGDQQVLGQVRRSYTVAEANHAVGRVLHRLVQRALAAGKRVRSETAIGAAGASVVTAALRLAERTLVENGAAAGLEGKTTVLIGTGAMGALAAAHLTRAGCGHLYVVSRSTLRAQAMVARMPRSGTRAYAWTLDRLSEALVSADIVISATAAAEPVVSVTAVRDALASAHRDDPARQSVICDIGMPRNVDPAVADLPGVLVVDMDRICREPEAVGDVEEAHRIVAVEFSAYLADRRMAELAPTVTALRRHAAGVVEAELSRLDNRLPGLGVDHRDELACTVRRVVDKLLHTPSVRMRQLASTPEAADYATALRELFELDHAGVRQVRL